jgi:hypothetical protein
VSGCAREATKLTAETADASMPLRHFPLPFAILYHCDIKSNKLVRKTNLAARCACVFCIVGSGTQVTSVLTDNK